MRRLGMKGGKRRKSETSSDADSGENGGGGTGLNESANSGAGNETVEETPKTTPTPNKKKSRGRGKRDDDAASVATPGSEGAKNDADNNGETDADSTLPPADQENGNAAKSGAKKRKREKPKAASAAASTSQDDDNEYEVEKIVAHRTIKGRRQFLVRWKGYSDDSDTWEQEKDLNCQQLIDDFLADEDDKQEEQNSVQNHDESPKAKKGRKSGTKKEKNKQNQDSKKGDDNEEDAKEFEVEKIIEVHFKKNKEREFLIRWKGFNSNDDTWEPEKNLNCPDLIAKFMDKVNRAKTVDSRELRTNPAHTKRYTLTTHETGRRLSRRNFDKQRTTYYQCDE